LYTVLNTQSRLQYTLHTTTVTDTVHSTQYTLHLPCFPPALPPLLHYFATCLTAHYPLPLPTTKHYCTFYPLTTNLPSIHYPLPITLYPPSIHYHCPESLTVCQIQLSHSRAQHLASLAHGKFDSSPIPIGEKHVKSKSPIFASHCRDSSSPGIYFAIICPPCGDDLPVAFSSYLPLIVITFPSRAHGVRNSCQQQPQTPWCGAR
jgi:hypothetical protein